MNCKRGFESFYGWLALIPNPIIQTNEAWFLTNTEKIHALFCKLCEVIDTVNSYQELMKKLADILDDFDETVREELIKYIKELYDSGELSEMIGKIIAESIVPAQSVLDPSHIARVLHYAHYWEAEGYGDSTYDIERYSYAQGNACFIGEDGNKYWCVAYVCQNGSHFEKNDSAMLYLYKYNENDLNNPMQYMSRVLLRAVGHCNGLCYHKGYIYITPNSYATTEGQISAGLTKDVIRFKVDFTSHTISGYGERATPTNPELWTDCICSTGEELYFTDGKLNIYKYDFDTNNAELVHSKIGGKYVTRPQNGMAIDDNYIYFLGSDQRIYRYNRRIETIDLCYQLPMSCNNHMFKTGEIECLSLIDDVLYMGSCYNLGQRPIVSSVSVTRFLRQNVKTNGIPATQGLQKNSSGNLYRYPMNWSSSGTHNITLWVAGDIPNDEDDPINPFGYIKEDGFRCAQEALDFIESNEWIKRVDDLNIFQRVCQIPVDIKTTKPMNISGSKYKEATGDRPIIGHIYAYKCHDIFFSDLCVRVLYSDDVIPKLKDREGKDNCLYLYLTVATISELYCPVGTQHPQVDKMVLCTGGFLNFANPVTTEENWSHRPVSNPKYLLGGNSTINSHGNATKSNPTIIA